ncbi:hypothetical protein Mapa_013789 [Marchantia paleacea]|nr:hypothetical protein Mapa_013789 [Marchantia paleacea]
MLHCPASVQSPTAAVPTYPIVVQTELRQLLLQHCVLSPRFVIYLAASNASLYVGLRPLVAHVMIGG